MKNITTKFDAKTGLLTLTIDTKKRLGPSASGKTTIIATTAGNAPLPEAPEIIMGINVYCKA